jgi:hypothetical protein
MLYQVSRAVMVSLSSQQSYDEHVARIRYERICCRRRRVIVWSSSPVILRTGSRGHRYWHHLVPLLRWACTKHTGLLSQLEAQHQRTSIGKETDQDIESEIETPGTMNMNSYWYQSSNSNQVRV